jgi:hypothetical protein
VIDSAHDSVNSDNRAARASVELSFVWHLVIAVVLALSTLVLPLAATASEVATLRCTNNNCKLTPSELPFFTIENGVPGITQQRVLTASNLRKDACALSTTIIPLAEQVTLPLERIFIAVQRVGGESYLGEIHQGAARATITAAELAAAARIFGYLKAGESSDFIWYATIDPSLENSYQGSATRVNLQLQMRCADPESILPKPTPSPTSPPPTPLPNSTPSPSPNSATTIATTSTSAPTTSAPTATNVPNITTQQVLGASTDAPNCPLTRERSLVVTRTAPTTAELKWRAQLGAVTVAYQDLTTKSIFRHRAVRRSPYTLQLQAASHEYAFWLEEETPCGDQLASERVKLAANNSAITHESAASVATESTATAVVATASAASNAPKDSTEDSFQGMVLGAEENSNAIVIGRHDRFWLLLAAVTTIFFFLLARKRKKDHTKKTIKHA